MEKIRARWAYGVFVGVKRRSNELMISTPEGIHFVRAVRRIPAEKRWGEDCVNWVKWAPWRRYKDAEDADGDVPEGVVAEEPRAREGVGDRVIVIETREKTQMGFLYFQR